jgi:hypothetical protein
MTGFWLFMAVIIALPGVVGWRQHADDSVVGQIVVRTADGVVVSGLGPSAFRLTCSGRASPIDEVKQGLPVSIVLVLDVSTSVSAHQGLGVAADDPATRFGRWFGDWDAHGGRLGPALEKGFIGRLRPVERAVIGYFGASGLSLSKALTNDRQELLAEVRNAIAVAPSERLGPSPLWDSLAIAIPLAAQQPFPRAVMVWTDGEATGNHRSYAEVRDLAVARRVPVVVVSEATERRLVQSRTTALVASPGSQLTSLAQATGGAYLPDTGESRDPSPLFSRAVDDLTHSYVVSRAHCTDPDVHVQPSALRGR